MLRYSFETENEIVSKMRYISDNRVDAGDREIFEEAITLLFETISQEQPIELNEVQIDAVVDGMVTKALSIGSDQPYLVPWLYRQAKTEPGWRQLSANTRKAIGRSFKRATDVFKEKAELGDPIINFEGKTAQNASLYKTRVKTEDKTLVKTVPL